MLSHKRFAQRHFAALFIGFQILKLGICSTTSVPKIAIIGGGIGGASTSHFLTELFDGNLEIDLYEGKKIGGRLATVKIDDEEYEAGGSVIHPKNRYMQHFVKILGLEHRDSSDHLSGIWDGEQFVFEESNWQSMNILKLLLRYGIQPFKLNSYVNTILDDFEKIYDLQDSGVYFKNVTTLMAALNTDFPKLLQTSIKDNLLSLDYNTKIINELVQATLVVNYGQDVNVHSFVGVVSLAGAGSGLWAVKGGNREVPEHLLYRNKKVNIIPCYVRKISYNSINSETQQYEIHYSNENSPDMMQSKYDIVVIATPLTDDQERTIDFEGFPNSIMNFPGKYHTTVATFVKGDLNPTYFGLDEKLDAILSCNPNETIFNSVGRLDPVDKAMKDSRVWKIFSKEALKSSSIHNMFSTVDEVEEIVWKAYPAYSTDLRFHQFKLHDALYHVNAIEWAASAMEMSAIAGRNVAILAHSEFNERYSSPIKVRSARLHSSEL